MAGSVPAADKTSSPIRFSEKPWDLWVAEIGHASPRRDEDARSRGVAGAEAGKAGAGGRRSSTADKRTERRRSARAGVTRLHRSCMSLYGQFPSTDLLNAAVCHLCGMTIKCSAVHRHLLASHSAAVAPILPPPPPAPTVKLKAHSKSKAKKELPPPPPPVLLPEVEPLVVPIPPDPITVELPPPPIPVAVPRIVVTQQELAYFPEAQVSPTKLSTQSEVQVSVEDNDLPVVSIQDNADLPMGDNLTDDIIEIMNSEGIQSIEDLPEADPAAWKNIMQDFNTIGEITIQNPAILAENMAAHELYHPGSTTQVSATYTLTSDDGTLHYTQPVTLSPVLPVDPHNVAAFPSRPAHAAPVKPRPKSGKSSKPKYPIKEYDPNKHCGVLLADTRKPCTRSLTCKAHTLSLRRQVEGRVKPFDMLLAEHRASKLPLVVTAAPPALAEPSEPVAISIASPLHVSAPVDISAFGSLSPEGQVTDYYSTILSSVTGALPPGVAEEAELVSLLPAEVAECLGQEVVVPGLPLMPPAPTAPPEPPRLPEPRPADVYWYPSSPRALATCTFSTFHMAGGLTLGRRLATVRSDFKTTLMQPHSKTVTGNFFNFSQNTINKTINSSSGAKPTVPEVRKLVMSFPPVSGSAAKADSSAYSNNANNRLNGHLFCNKRPLLEEYEEADKCLRTGVSGQSVRSKVPKHMTQGDLLELNFMFDPLLADEKC